MENCYVNCRQRGNSGLGVCTDTVTCFLTVSKSAQEQRTPGRCERACVHAWSCVCVHPALCLGRTKAGWSVQFFSCVADLQQKQTCGAARLFTQKAQKARGRLQVWAFYLFRKYICKHTWTRTQCSTSGLVLDTAAAPPVTHPDFARGGVEL